MTTEPYSSQGGGLGGAAKRYLDAIKPNGVPHFSSTKNIHNDSSLKTKANVAPVQSQTHSRSRAPSILTGRSTPPPQSSFRKQLQQSGYPDAVLQSRNGSSSPSYTRKSDSSKDCQRESAVALCDDDGAVDLIMDAEMPVEDLTTATSRSVEAGINKKSWAHEYDQKHRGSFLKRNTYVETQSPKLQNRTPHAYYHTSYTPNNHRLQQAQVIEKKLKAGSEITGSSLQQKNLNSLYQQSNNSEEGECDEKPQQTQLSKPLNFDYPSDRLRPGPLHDEKDKKPKAHQHKSNWISNSINGGNSWMDPSNRPSSTKQAKYPDYPATAALQNKPPSNSYGDHVNLHPEEKEGDSEQVKVNKVENAKISYAPGTPSIQKDERIHRRPRELGKQVATMTSRKFWESISSLSSQPKRQIDDCGESCTNEDLPATPQHLISSSSQHFDDKHNSASTTSAVQPSITKFQSEKIKYRELSTVSGAKPKKNWSHPGPRSHNQEDIAEEKSSGVTHISSKPPQANMYIDYSDNDQPPDLATPKEKLDRINYPSSRLKSREFPEKPIEPEIDDGKEGISAQQSTSASTTGGFLSVRSRLRTWDKGKKNDRVEYESIRSISDTSPDRSEQFLGQFDTHQYEKESSDENILELNICDLGHEDDAKEISILDLNTHNISQEFESVKLQLKSLGVNRYEKNGSKSRANPSTFGHLTKDPFARNTTKNDAGIPQTILPLDPPVTLNFDDQDLANEFDRANFDATNTIENEAPTIFGEDANVEEGKERDELSIPESPLNFESKTTQAEDKSTKSTHFPHQQLDNNEDHNISQEFTSVKLRIESMNSKRVRSVVAEKETFTKSDKSEFLVTPSNKMNIESQASVKFPHQISYPESSTSRFGSNNFDENRTRAHFTKTETECESVTERETAKDEAPSTNDKLERLSTKETSSLPLQYAADTAQNINSVHGMGKVDSLTNAGRKSRVARIAAAFSVGSPANSTPYEKPGVFFREENSHMSALTPSSSISKSKHTIRNRNNIDEEETANTKQDKRLTSVHSSTFQGTKNVENANGKALIISSALQFTPTKNFRANTPVKSRSLAKTQLIQSPSTTLYPPSKDIESNQTLTKTSDNKKLNVMMNPVNDQVAKEGQNSGLRQDPIISKGKVISLSNIPQTPHTHLDEGCEKSTTSLQKQPVRKSVTDRYLRTKGNRSIEVGVKKPEDETTCGSIGVKSIRSRFEKLDPGGSSQVRMENQYQSSSSTAKEDEKSEGYTLNKGRSKQRTTFQLNRKQGQENYTSKLDPFEKTLITVPTIPVNTHEDSKGEINTFGDNNQHADSLKTAFKPPISSTVTSPSVIRRRIETAASQNRGDKIEEEKSKMKKASRSFRAVTNEEKNDREEQPHQLHNVEGAEQEKSRVGHKYARTPINSSLRSNFNNFVVERDDGGAKEENKNPHSTHMHSSSTHLKASWTESQSSNTKDHENVLETPNNRDVPDIKKVDKIPDKTTPNDKNEQYTPTLLKASMDKSGKPNGNFIPTNDDQILNKEEMPLPYSFPGPAVEEKKSHVKIKENAYQFSVDDMDPCDPVAAGIYESCIEHPSTPQPNDMNYYEEEDDDCDGVTLSPVPSDVSSLSIPSCLLDHEFSLGSNSSSDEDTGAFESITEKQSSARPSEASSSQTSEAAAPLIHSTLGTLNMKLTLTSITDVTSGAEGGRNQLLGAFSSVADDNYDDEVSQELILQKSHLQSPPIHVQGHNTPINGSVWDVSTHIQTSSQNLDNLDDWAVFPDDEIDDVVDPITTTDKRPSDPEKIITSKKIETSEEKPLKPSQLHTTKNTGFYQEDGNIKSSKSTFSDQEDDEDEDENKTDPFYENKSSWNNHRKGNDAQKTEILRTEKESHDKKPGENKYSPSPTRNVSQQSRKSPSSATRSSPSWRRANLQKVKAYKMARRRSFLK